MRWVKKKVQPVRMEDWHWWFAWKPTRVSADTIVWLERVNRKIVVDDEGTWAGGFVYHYEYMLNDFGQTPWAAAKVFD